MADPELHFIRDGIHTHLALPAPKLLALVPQLQRYFSNCQWIRIGWGDYRYYGAEHQPFWLGLRALFLPTSAVVGLLGTDDLRETLSESASLYCISLTEGLMDSVALFVSRHFMLDKFDQLIRVRARTCGTQFFKSRGTYLALNTCNNWTSRGLSRAGLDVHPLLTFLPGQVEQAVRENGYLPIEDQLPS